MLRKIPVLKKDVDEWTSFYKVQQTGQSASALKTAKISDYKMFSADRIEAELANVMTEYSITHACQINKIKNLKKKKGESAYDLNLRKITTLREEGVPCSTKLRAIGEGSELVRQNNDESFSYWDASGRKWCEFDPFQHRFIRMQRSKTSKDTLYDLFASPAGGDTGDSEGGDKNEEGDGVGSQESNTIADIASLLDELESESQSQSQ